MIPFSWQFQWIYRQSYWAARTLLAWGLAIGAFVFFSFTVPHFFSLGNMYSLIQVFAVLALLATGLGVVMLAAEFDLSIVGTFPLASLIVLQGAEAFGTTASLLIALIAGIGLGLLNGVGVGFLRIPSIAVTVATMILTVGLGYLVSHNNFVSMKDYTVSLELTRPILSVLTWQSIFELALVAAVIVAIKLTRWGRYLYATGGDNRKARASGLPVTQALFIAFALSAACGTVAGALQGLSLASGSPGPNNGILLEAATAVLIGGIAVRGGRGSLVGAVGGAFLLSVVNSGLGIAGTSAPMIELVSGALLIGVLALDRPLARFVRRRAELLVAEDPATPAYGPMAQHITPTEAAEG